MERVAFVFRSFEEAEKAEAEYYASLTPEQRIEIALQLRDLLKDLPNGSSERLERVSRITQLESR